MADPIRTPAEEAFLKALDARRIEGPDWLNERRRVAEELFREVGLPNRRVEAFKYTDLRGGLPGRLHPAPVHDGPVAIPDDLAALSPRRLVFANGRMREDLSDFGQAPTGVRVTSLARALDEEPALLERHLGRLFPDHASPTLALNAALWTDGPLIVLEDGAALDEPLHIIHALEGEAGAAAHARALILMGEGAQARILETHLGGGADTLSQLVSEITLGPRAHLERAVIQMRGAQAHHLSESLTRVGSGARYREGVLTLGAALSRHESRAVLEGEKARADLDGAYVLNAARVADHTLFIKHAAPDCESRQLYKGAIAEKARAVFQGKFFVDQVAQRTDAYQLNQALLLSERAEIDSKPELEIYADDVKCSHGATAGALDDGQLFYLRSRGIPEAEAAAMLSEAFLAEAIEAMPEFARPVFTERAVGALRALGAPAKEAA